MKNLRRRLRGREEVMRNEIFPWNALQSNLMYHNDLDERIMINVVVLLLGSLLLHKSNHPLYISAHEIWKVHNPHSREMHQQLDVVCIKA